MQHIIRTLMLVAGISCVQHSFAQDKTQGQIHYEITYHVHASLKPDQMQYKDLIPESVVEKAELIYKGQRLKAYFNDEVKKEEDGVSSSIKVATDDGSERYVDLDKKTLWWVDKAKNPPVLVEKPLFEQDKDSDKEVEHADTKKILDYTCKKLTFKSKDGTRTIWYTTELPLKAGTPLGQFTDKGVILALESKRMSFTATSIDFVPVAEGLITPPADLKIVKTSDQKGK
jgi:GLPGLI family protein